MYDEIVQQNIKADFTIIKSVFSARFIFNDLADGFSKNPFGVQIQEKGNGEQKQHEETKKPVNNLFGPA